MPGSKKKGQQQGANRDGEMKPRTGPQPLSHQRPGERITKSQSVSAALDDYLYNNPGGVDMRFYARRYGVTVGSLRMRLWREKMKDKEEEKGNDAIEALDSDEETMGSSSNETPPAVAGPTTTTRPERQSLMLPRPGKKASQELVEAAFDEYLHSDPPVSGLVIARKYGLHPSTMNKRIALMRMSKGVARGGGGSGKKTRSGRAINLRSNPPRSRRQQEAEVKPGSSSKSIRPPPPPPSAPATVTTIARGQKQARTPAKSRARADRINSAMEYIIHHNPGHCYKHVAKKFGVGYRTLFGRAAKLRAAGIYVPASKIPGRIPVKQDTYITTGSSRHEGLRVQQQQPSAGSAEEAIAAVTRVKSSTSQRQRQGQGHGEGQRGQEQDSSEKKKSTKKPLSKWDIYKMSKPERVDAAVDEFLNGNPGQSIPSIIQKYGIDHSTLYQGVTAMAARDRDTGLLPNSGGKSRLTKLKTSSGGTDGSAAKPSSTTQKKKSASRPELQSQSHQEREPGRCLGLRSSSRIKDRDAQTSASAAGVSSTSSNSNSSSINRSKEKSNNNDLHYMSRAERCDAAWEEYLYSNPRPKLTYFAEKYGIHKSTLSARKIALRKQGVDVDLLFKGSANANGTSGARTTTRAGAGAEVVDLMSSDSDLDSDLEDLEDLEESESEPDAMDDDEIIDVDSNATPPQPQQISPPSSRPTSTRRQTTTMELSDIQERYLVNWYLREESLGRGAPTRAKLTSMALSLLFDGQEAHLDLQDEEWLGVLIQRFLERNPDIKAVVGRGEGEDGLLLPREETLGCAPAPAPEARKAEEGVRMLWEPTAAEAAAAAAAMGYVSEDDDEEGDWEDEEETDSEETESDELASDSENSEEDDSDSDSDSDTSTNTSTDDIYNQAFVESLFVKLESTPSPPPLSPAAAVAATEGGHEHCSLPTPQSSHDIQQHYLSALHDSRSATQTAQIVKTLCTKAGKALDLKNSALEALREKVELLEREVGELKMAKINITVAAGDDDDDDDGLLGPDPGPGFSHPPGLLSSEERHEQEEQQQEQKQEQQQEGQEGKKRSSSGSMNIMSSASNVDAKRANVERDATTTTTDKGLSASSSIIPPPLGSATPLPLPPPPERERERGREGGETTNEDLAPDTSNERLVLAGRLLGLEVEKGPKLEEASSVQESMRGGGGNEEGSQGSEETEESEESESEESESESDCGNEREGSNTKRPSLTDTSTIVSHSNSRKRRMVDIEVVLEARRMFGFAHYESIGPWTGAYTIGPGPGKKRRRITERSGGFVSIAGRVSSTIVSRTVTQRMVAHSSSA